MVSQLMEILLVDTFSLFFRSFYALPPMSTKAGEPTGALYGFSALLLKLLREERPGGVAFALDLPKPTVRKGLYAAYKAERPAPPDPLKRQLARLPELLAAFGFPSFAHEGWEADDVLASLSEALSRSGHGVLIASGDRDLLQLVSARVHVLFLGARGKAAERYDPERVQKRFGIPAARLPTYVALVGDSSDNLPKVPGVGGATAERLVSRCADVNALLEDLDALGDARLAQRLRDHAEQMRLSERLARLRRDLALPEGPRFLPFDESAKRRTRALFERLEFRSLIPRVDALG